MSLSVSSPDSPRDRDAASFSSVSPVRMPVGFSWKLLDAHFADGENVDKWMDSMREHYIMKSDLQICTGEAPNLKIKNHTVVLTEESWIELTMHTPMTASQSAPPADSESLVVPSREKKHMTLLEIHSIEADPNSPSSFRINFFSGSASSKAKARISKVKRLFQVGSSFDDFLKQKTVRCNTAEECTQWMLVLEKLQRNLWQRKIESALLPAPEYYKRHAFVIKQHNDRLLLLSDMWFYNVEVSYKPIAVKGIKWAIPVSSFTHVRQSNVDPTVALMTISFDADEAKKQFDSHHRSNKSSDLRNKHHEFIFRTRDERQRFVNSLAAVYWQVTRRKLIMLE